MHLFHAYILTEGNEYHDGHFANKVDAQCFILDNIIMNQSWFDFWHLFDKCYDDGKFNQLKVQELLFPQMAEDIERGEKIVKIISEHMEKTIRDSEEPFESIQDIIDDFPCAELLPLIDWEEDFEGCFIKFEIQELDLNDIVGAVSKNPIEPHSCYVTHDGTFHADELFAVALLRHVFGPGEVVRTRDIDKIRSLHTKGAHVVDVGGEYDGMRKFDHHQEDMNMTYGACNIPLSSFGMVWKAFGLKYLKKCGLGSSGEIKQAHADEFYELFVKSIDANDNGVPLFDTADGKQPLNYLPVQLFTAVAMINNASDASDKWFHRSLIMVEIILTNVAESFVSKCLELETCAQKFKDAWEKNKEAEVLELDFDPLTLDTHKILNKELRAPNTKFIMFPRASNSTWRVWTRRTGNGFELTAPLMSETEARALFGDSVVFIHKAKFVGEFGSREVALAVAQKSC